MITRTILVKVKEGTTEEQKQALVAGLKGLAGIPGVISATAGESAGSPRPEGYGIGCTVVFQDREALAGYGPHPLHMGMVTELLRPNSDGTLLFDVES